MTIIRFLSLMAVAGAMNSCLPGPYGTYYKPSYPDETAVLERKDCGGKVGPRSVIKIPTRDGSIYVRLEGNRHDRLELSMSLQTSGLSTLQFSSNVIRLKDLDKGTEWAIDAKDLNLGYKFGQILHTKAVDFTTILPAAPENILNDMEVWIPFSIENFSPSTVRVQLPLIVVGSNGYQIPPLLWKADKEGKTVEGYKKSWSWWPYKDERVKVYNFTVHAGATGGFHGRTKIGAPLKVPELSGNIMINFPADVKWRFAANEILFEDVSSGKVKQIHFNYMRTQSAMRVAFTTQFCCTKSASARLSMGESWPEKLRIELPPLIINNKAFVIKPITFNLRRFEFGIYPFNC